MTNIADNAQSSLKLEAAQTLERIRASKNITRRGAIICGQAMAEMLRIGWEKEDLDALEILFWAVHDGNGEVILNQTKKHE